MDIGFVWDENKYQKVVDDHHVAFYEVVSAFDDQDGYEVTDPAGHEDRWMWVGQTVQGRVLGIIYSEEDLPLYRLITAFDAEGGWLDEYQRHRV
jgi:uncharacterized DUF497 family protein